MRGRLEGTVRVVRAVLRNRALRRVELAFLLFNSVEFGSWVAILLYAYDVTGPASVGLVALGQLLPAGAFAPFAASLADRLPRARVLALGYLLQGGAFAVAAAGMLLAAPPLLVYLAAAAAVAALTITRPAQGSLLPALSRTPEELTAANGLSGTVEGAGLLLGPSVAAAILVTLAPGHVFAAAAVACLVALLLVARLPMPRRTGSTPSHPTTLAQGSGVSHGGLIPGLRAAASNPATRLVLLVLGLRMVVSGAMDVLFVLYALEVLGTGESGAAILSASLGLGTVVGGAATFSLVGRRRLAPPMAMSAAVLSLALAVAATAASPITAPLVLAAGGIGYAASDVIGRTILQRAAPDAMLARILGTLEGVGLVGLALGSVLVPVVVLAVGVQAAFYAFALVLPLTVLAAWRGLTRIDREVLVPTREIAVLRAVPIFAPLPPPALEAVARRARWRTAEPGTTIIREGDVGDVYYVIESGAIRVRRGGEELRTVHGSGYGFGEIALLRDVPRTATVTAMEPSVLLTLERGDFLEALTGHEPSHLIAREEAAERLTSTAAPGS
jgi:MFS family permease